MPLISRRTLLKQCGAAALLAAAPKLLVRPAWAQVLSFNYYISPAGSDSNPGTLSQPWAITSCQVGNANFSKLNGTGVSVGFLPGTYNVGALMGHDEVVGALQFPGGNSGNPNIFASCNSGGVYSPRAATINAKSNGLFGGNHATGPGVYDGPVIAHSGKYPSPYAVGNIIIDGLTITGFSYKGMTIGQSSDIGTNYGFTGAVVRNCLFTGGGYNAGDYQDNMVSLWIDGAYGAVIENNLFLNNGSHGGSTSADHLNSIFFIGNDAVNGPQNTVVQYNTSINAGSIYGKEKGVQGSIIRYNYVDTSMFTSNGSTGYQDFTGANSPNLTLPTVMHNNIAVLYGNTPGGSVGCGWPTLSNTYGYSTPIAMYNNTVVVAGGSAGPSAFWTNCFPAAAGQLQFYNNIYTSAASGGSWNGNGNFMTNPGAPAIWDYNLFPASGMSWGLYQNSALYTQIGMYSSASAFASALSSNGGIANAEAHSIAGKPTFVGGSPAYPAQAYQLASGSLGHMAGSLTGANGGGATDMGAWGNGAIQIGCNWNSSSCP